MIDTGLQGTNGRDALAALAWLVEAGVDVLVDAEPRNWLAVADEPQVTERTEAQPAPISPAIIGGAEPIAARADTLEALRAAVEAFEGCPLKAAAKRTVFADGEPTSGVMLIGEAPGAEEDRVGRPFVGEAGRLLDRMLAAIGRDRTSAYISNTLFWRPPGNRTPSPQEIETCLPFVLRHIELVRPRAILALGGTAAKTLLNSADGINKLRGRWHEIRVGECVVPVMPTFHPAYLLRQPAHKALAWADLLAFKTRIDA